MTPNEAGPFPQDQRSDEMAGPAGRGGFQLCGDTVSHPLFCAYSDIASRHTC